MDYTPLGFWSKDWFHYHNQSLLSRCFIYTCTNIFYKRITSVPQLYSYSFTIIPFPLAPGKTSCMKIWKLIKQSTRVHKTAIKLLNDTFRISKPLYTCMYTRYMYYTESLPKLILKIYFNNYHTRIHIQCTCMLVLF